jgi:hypothetical protein
VELKPNINVILLTPVIGTNIASKLNVNKMTLLISIQILCHSLYRLYHKNNDIDLLLFVDNSLKVCYYIDNKGGNMKQAFKEIDVKEVDKADTWMHFHPAIKSLDRYLRKWMKRAAPLTGIVLINGEIMKRIV